MRINSQVRCYLVVILCLSSLQQSVARRRTRQRHQNREQVTDDDVDYADYDETQDRVVERRERERIEREQEEFKKRIRHKLLIIVLDGFRWDYMDMFENRTGDRLAGFRTFQSEGASAEYLESVFPTESFPAWQTLQTGLYPGNHDIVGNVFYDPEIHRQVKDENNDTDYAFFNILDERATSHLKWWQKHEPLWATAKKNNISFSAYLWARCDIPYEAEIRLRVDYCEHLYMKDLTKTLRINVDKALINFQRGMDASIIYDDSLEKAAEEFGPLSNAVIDKIKELDRGVQHLLQRLSDANMADIVNVVILSDHGMTYASSPVKMHHPPDFNLDEIEVQRIQISDILGPNIYKAMWIVGSGSHAGIYPRKPKYRQDIVQLLSNVRGIQVYDRNDVPERFHYKKSNNTPPILVLAEPGTVIDKSSSNVQRPGYPKPRRGMHSFSRVTEQTKMGLSGYDPEVPDMRGIFMVKGPDFKDGGEVMGPVRLVDVYELLCKVLNIAPKPNDGALDMIMAFLRGGSCQTSSWSLGVTILIGLTVTLTHF